MFDYIFTKDHLINKSYFISKNVGKWSFHTGLEALPSKKKWSIDGTGVPGFLSPVWLWDRVAKPEKMGKKINLVKKLVKNT